MEELYQVIGKMRKVISHVAHLPVWLSAGLSGHRNTFEKAYVHSSISSLPTPFFLYFSETCKGGRDGGVGASLTVTGLKPDFSVNFYLHVLIFSDFREIK